MVRLLPCLSPTTLSASVMFQSHNGAIAASIAASPTLISVGVSIPQWCDCCPLSPKTIRQKQRKFQSHNGAIAAAELNDELAGKLSFNPTMVRLLRCYPAEPERLNRAFQSHNGAIAAKFARSSLLLPRMFQSHNGAIAAAPLPTQPTNSVLVSIPQWCDCCYGVGLTHTVGS